VRLPPRARRREDEEDEEEDDAVVVLRSREENMMMRWCFVFIYIIFWPLFLFRLFFYVSLYF
jgi:hypothetical protein